jgi:hypothetical protein
LVKDKKQGTKTEKKAALLLFFVGTGFTLHRPAVNTALIAASFPSLLVSLFSVWQIETMPILVLGSGGGGGGG